MVDVVPIDPLFSTSDEKCFEPEKQGFLQSRQLRRVKPGCLQSGSAAPEEILRPSRSRRCKRCRRTDL
jgi:hypothetical protein